MGCPVAGCPVVGCPGCAIGSGPVVPVPLRSAIIVAIPAVSHGRFDDAPAITVAASSEPASQSSTCGTWGLAAGSLARQASTMGFSSSGTPVISGSPCTTR